MTTTIDRQLTLRDAPRPATTMVAGDPERRLRRRLGVPDTAYRVLVLGESSHWDPNWLLTSGEYFKLRVQRILDRAIDALSPEDRRVYSIECVFFLKLYWDVNPSRRDAIRLLVNEGRLRLTGSGANGMSQKPRIAYLPDNFGHSPAVPSILRGLRVSGVAFARLDGGYFPGCDYRRQVSFPLSGSNAERLLLKEKSVEFVWRDEAGAEVLARFHPDGYGQGDLLAHRGLTRWRGLPLAVGARSERRVAARIADYVARLAPLSRTPYLFCPIGFDFVEPIDDLVGLLDRHNRARFSGTGVFVVNAALDDYFDLVDCHRERLPVLALDPNPHWMGFTASRPALKRACRLLADTLLEVDALTVRDGVVDDARLADAWFWESVGNHHDFITGTSSDRVYRLEQKPRMDAALSSAHDVLTKLQASQPIRAAVPTSASAGWSRSGDRVEVRTAHLLAELDARLGGCISRLTDLRTGLTLLREASADLVSCHDSGGLWRMGHEFRGGSFEERERQSSRRVEIDVRERPGAVEVVTRRNVAGGLMTRTIWLRTDVPLVRVRVDGLVGTRRSLLLRFHAGPFAENATMNVPGGTVNRPPTRLHAPTFWAMNRFTCFRGRDGARGVTLLAKGPASVSFDPDGTFDCLALRNATRERAFGCLPMLGFPVGGHERDAAHTDVAPWFPADDDVWEGRPHLLAREAFDDPWDAERREATGASLGALVRTDCMEAQVLAIKRASRGDGIIVRLYLPALNVPRDLALRWQGASVVRALLCDARERDMMPLRIDDGAAIVPVRETILSVRLVTGS